MPALLINSYHRVLLVAATRPAERQRITLIRSAPSCSSCCQAVDARATAMTKKKKKLRHARQKNPPRHDTTVRDEKNLAHCDEWKCVRWACRTEDIRVGIARRVSQESSARCDEMGDRPARRDDDDHTCESRIIRSSAHMIWLVLFSLITSCVLRALCKLLLKSQRSLTGIYVWALYFRDFSCMAVLMTTFELQLFRSSCSLLCNAKRLFFS